MKVQIKTWEEMEKEFGLTRSGLIPCGSNTFVRGMEILMPLDRIIEVSELDIWTVDGEDWYITDEMISKKFLDELPEEIIIPEDEPEKVDIFADDIFAINLNAIKSITKANNHIHYLKWKITDNLSVRYFYSFDTKSEMIGKFGLKNHKYKQLTEISEETAKEMICSFCVEKFDEIIGYNVKGYGFKKYVKKFGENFVTFKNDK